MKTTVEEDVVAFGEEVADLDVITGGVELDEGGRQDYSRAIDEYDRAEDLLDRISSADEISHVTEAIEDGRYAAKCVRARVEGEPLPVRRPPASSTRSTDRPSRTWIGLPRAVSRVPFRSALRTRSA